MTKPTREKAFLANNGLESLQRSVTDLRTESRSLREQTESPQGHLDDSRRQNLVIVLTTGLVILAVNSIILVLARLRGLRIGRLPLPSARSVDLARRGCATPSNTRWRASETLSEPRFMGESSM